MKNLLVLLLVSTASAFSQKAEIAATIDNSHKFAAEAKLDAYIGCFTKDATYIGTDATENWTMEQFRTFAKPYFDAKKTWDFKSLERHIYVSADGSFAWFDELLDTHMKICRGSGVLKKENGQWKIAQYVLSMTVPNDTIEEVLKAKAKVEDAYVEKLKKKK